MQKQWILQVITAGLIGLTSCSQSQPQTSETKFDSAHSVAVDASIPEGTIVATSDNDAVIKRQVREQLMYTIGQMNGRNGGVDMNRFSLEIQNKEELADGKFEVTYAAKLFLSWQRTTPVSESITFIVPARGDYAGLGEFFDAFGSDEHESKKCLAWEAHDVTQGLLWYYYRPEKSGCSLKNGGETISKDLVRFLKADLVVSDQNTEGKSPEYEKVWEDDTLVVTAIYGKADYGATSNGDAGISAYRRTYNLILKNLGEPLTNNLLEGESPNVENDEVKLTFAVDHGTLDIHLYLVDDIKSVNQEFRDKYNKRTQNSDYVSYSGHSGLGANIRALANMGKFAEGQYQIFLINGCDTFAYVDDSLRKAHQAVNPEHGLDKFVDVITNAMPAFFSALPQDNWAVINGLLGKTQTYREILSGFDTYQRAAVTGEEDNNWPEPFINQ
jgi:hypothetical protein